MRRLAILLVLAPGPWAVPALAQQAEQALPPTVRPIFGTGTGTWGQDLRVSGSAGGGVDDDVLGDAHEISGGASFDPLRQRRGGVGSLSGSMSYQVSRRTFVIGALAGTSLRLYPGEARGRRRIQRDAASVTLSADLTRRTQVRVGQSIANRPFTIRGLLAVSEDDLADGPTGIGGASLAPVAIEPVEIDAYSRYLTLATTANVSRQFSPRTTVTASYRNSLSTSPVHDGRFGTHTWAGGVVRALTANVGLRLGYSHSQARYPSGDRRIRDHGLDVGLDYGRQLAISRRTTVSFTTGSTVVTEPPVESEGNSRARFRLTGSAALTHAVTQTWQATARFRRGLKFVELLREPVFADSIATTLGGPLSRRVTFSSSAQASIGAVGTPGRHKRYDTYHGNAAVDVALNAQLRATVAYDYSHYRFGADVLLPPGVSSRVGRHSVRAQVTAWAPLFERRSRHAAR